MKTVRKVRIVADALQIAVSVFVQLYLKTELPFLFWSAPNDSTVFF